MLASIARLIARISALPFFVAMIASPAIKSSLIPCFFHASVNVRLFAIVASIILIFLLAMLQLS
jgi:hypothetical protein